MLLTQIWVKMYTLGGKESAFASRLYRRKKYKRDR